MRENTGKRSTSPGHRFWLPLLVFIAGLIVYVPTVGGAIVNTDNQAAAVSAWRIATTGRPWMDGVDTSDLEGAQIDDAWLVAGAHGHMAQNRTAGVVIPAIPFYWALNNDPDPKDFEIWVGGIAAATYTALAGLLLFLALRRRVPAGLAVGGVAAFLFATPTWSVSANAMWTHTITELALAGSVWALSRQKWVASGAFLGIGILARPHIAVVAGILGLGLALSRRDWRVAVRVGVPAMLGLVTLVLWNKAVFGAWSVRGGYDNYVLANLASGVGESGASSVQNLLGFLVSPDRGFLVWTPAVLLLMPTLIRSWHGLPDWSRWLSVAGIAYTVVQLRINSFTGGEGYYGYRLGLELLVCLLPALVLAFQRTSRRTRVVMGGLLGLQFAAIALGATVDGFFVQIEDVWRDNSFLLALRDQPAAVGTLTGLCVALGLLGALWATRGANSVAVSGPGRDVSVADDADVTRVTREPQSGG